MEKERLLYNISRFDHYYDSVNNKTAVYIAINSFVVGSLITTYISTIDDILFYTQLFKIITITSVFIGVLTLLILVNASIPYFTKNSKSMYYFGGIGSMVKDEFICCSKELSNKQELKDLRNQVHTLSMGLNKKFMKLKVAGKLLILQFILLVPTLIIIILNNK